MFFLSARGMSLASAAMFRASGSLFSGTDSPVRAASSTLSEAASIILPSAGTLSPASRTTMSPGTSSWLSMVIIVPPRSTLDLAAVICLRASMASSALFSCTTPSTELRITTKSMMNTSVGLSFSYIEVTRESMAATSSMIIIGSFI